MAKIRAWEPSGPGKFFCRADERVYRMTLDGCCDTLGESDGFGLFAKIDGPILGLSSAGAILNEDSNGFVSVEYYDNADDLARGWGRIEQEYNRWLEDFGIYAESDPVA